MLPKRSPSLILTRSVSSSPYGRSHIWLPKNRAPTLPNPLVPKYPQRVIRADGSSFTHWTTSPRSRIRLTRDTTNNPTWNTGMWSSENAFDDQDKMSGRLGRFSRRFEGLGRAASKVEWVEGEKKL